MAKSNLEELNSGASETIWTYLMEMVVVKFCSYRSEFNEWKKLIKNEELRDAFSKVMKNINKKWPHIDDYRNQIIAHEFRKSKKSVFSDIKNTNYKIPTSMIDLVEIHFTVEAISKALEEEYPKFFGEIENFSLMKKSQGGSTI